MRIQFARSFLPRLTNRDAPNQCACECDVSTFLRAKLRTGTDSGVLAAALWVRRARRRPHHVRTLSQGAATSHSRRVTVCPAAAPFSATRDAQTLLLSAGNRRHVILDAFIRSNPRSKLGAGLGPPRFFTEVRGFGIATDGKMYVGLTHTWLITF
jgi:hypothetical protein